MKKLLTVLCLTLATLSASCAGALQGGTLAPIVPAVTVPVYTFGIVACDTMVGVEDPCPVPVGGAVILVNSTSGYVQKTANKDGYALFTSIIPFSDVKIHADGYGETAVGIEPPKINGKNISLSMVRDHVDPSTLSLPQLAAIRGAMWPLGPVAGLAGGLPLGPRPGADDNVIATDFITDYENNVQDAIIHELKRRGYTHVVMGPLVDSDGYHGMWSPNDWRYKFDEFLDAAQRFWDAGLYPIVFLHPDNWSFEQTRDELTPLLQTPRAQKLLRIVVPAGWEPTKYGWSSCTWALYGSWARTVLPHALVALHTVSDTDAPAGTDARCNDDDHTWNPGGNAAAWGRVAPNFHVWLVQSGAFDNPTGTGGDREHPELTNFQNWARQFDVRVRGSYRDRFENGYAGWPKSSAWGEGKPLRVICGEYDAYWKFWQHRSEEEGVSWGNACMADGVNGAYGYLDSGSVPVLIRQ